MCFVVVSWTHNSCDLRPTSDSAGTRGSAIIGLHWCTLDTPHPIVAIQQYKGQIDNQKGVNRSKKFNSIREQVAQEDKSICVTRD